MGATTFCNRQAGSTAQQAFKAAREEALYDHGHSGYSGTIAEKSKFVMISVPEGEIAMNYAWKLIDEGDARVDDKWGPAGCIDEGDGNYLFFGWASE